MLSLAILRCHTIIIHYSCVSHDCIIAASAVEKSCFFILRYYRKYTFSPSSDWIVLKLYTFHELAMYHCNLIQRQ